MRKHFLRSAVTKKTLEVASDAILERYKTRKMSKRNFNFRGPRGDGAAARRLHLGIDSSSTLLLIITEGSDANPLPS